MSDFSSFALFTAGLACVVPLCSAYTQPVGANPLGNPIYTPNSGDIVQAGKDYNITWGPTTTGTVTLLLLKGPSTNAVPQYPIVENINNVGYYLWTPSTNLEPSQGAEGYGIELIVDASGQYQYSTQFGISNDNSGSSSSSGDQNGPQGYGSGSSWGSTASGSPSPSANVTSAPAYKSSGTVPLATAPGTASTGYFPSNATVMKPTGSLTVPSTLQSSASATATVSGPTASGSAAPAASSKPPTSNSASGLATSFAGLVVAAGVAVFAL